MDGHRKGKGRQRKSHFNSMFKFVVKPMRWLAEDTRYWGYAESTVDKSVGIAWRRILK